LVRGRAREHQLPRPRDGLGSRSCSRASITKTTGKPCTVLQYPSKKEQTLVFRGGEAKVRPSLFSAFLGLEKRLIRLFLAFFLFVLNPPNGKIKSTKNIDASEQSLTTYIYSYSQHIYIHTHNMYIFILTTYIYSTFTTLPPDTFIENLGGLHIVDTRVQRQYTYNTAQVASIDGYMCLK